MEKKLSFDYSTAGGFVSEEEVASMKAMVQTARDVLVSKSGAGNDYLGWIDLPADYDKEEFFRIQKAAEKITGNSEVFLVIGIGGSYLGAKAANDFLNHPFYNNLPKEIRKTPEIYYVGNNMSAAYINGLIDVIGQRDFSINVISKSGATTELAIAFRVFKELLERRYGKEASRDRIYTTTDKAKGTLKMIADNEGYETFVVPDDIGGRFSVLTAVGLLPIAVSGVSIEGLMQGATYARDYILNDPYEENGALKYAAVRNILHRKGKAVEILVNYEPTMQYISEWWKQLYAESEGKDNKGIYPSSANFTTDLHSLGQFIQDGSRILFETVLCVDEPKRDMLLGEMEGDLDGLNYLAGKGMDFVNKAAMKGTLLAHTEGKTPNLMIHIPRQEEFCLGQLFYFFEFACGVSGYLNGVNPFNQPGVESYKANMFALLGKPSYEK